MFKNEIKSWVHAFVQDEENKRRYILKQQQREFEIAWLQNRIKDLEKELKKRPRKAKHIRELKYQLRRLELEIAFDDNGK